MHYEDQAQGKAVAMWGGTYMQSHSPPMTTHHANDIQWLPSSQCTFNCRHKVAKQTPHDQPHATDPDANARYLAQSQKRTFMHAQVSPHNSFIV